MSQERFDWLDRWCENPADDVIRTPGTESQRQGDLRRLQRAGAGPDELRAQPVLRVRQPPRPLRGHRAGARPRVRARRARRGRDLRLAAFVVGHRVGRHDRRRRPAEGQVRHADRRRRGAGVPDDARERLRRAQHPGHRRQAHPADPQRDEHRRRRRAISDRATDELDVLFNTDAGRALPRRPQGASPPTSSTRSATSGSRRLQRARRDQDGQAARPRARRRDRHGRHRRRGDVPERAGQDARPRASAASSTTVDAAEVFGEHLADVDDRRTSIECTERATGSRIFNLGYYTWVEQQGTPFELFEQRRSQDVLARPAPLPRRVGRDDHRVQRPRRRR